MATIKKRRNTYHARAYVPADLHGIVGRYELARTLATSNGQAARSKAAMREGDLVRLRAFLRLNGADMDRDETC